MVQATYCPVQWAESQIVFHTLEIKKEKLVLPYNCARNTSLPIMVGASHSLKHWQVTLTFCLANCISPRLLQRLSIPSPKYFLNAYSSFPSLSLGLNLFDTDCLSVSSPF